MNLRKFYKFTFIAISLSIFVSCGSKSNNNSERAEEPPITKTALLSRAYQLKGFNGCDTGKIVVEAENKKSLDEKFCSTLQNADANKFCAESERIDFFLKECPDSKWSSTGTPKGLRQYLEASEDEKRIREISEFNEEIAKVFVTPI